MTQKLTLPHEEELNDLEAQLAGTLKPIHPSKDIIRRLRARIRFPDREEIKMRLIGNWRRLFLVFSGVMSGMLLLITLARAFYYMIGRKV
jgi:hypothetical protein